MDSVLNFNTHTSRWRRNSPVGSDPIKPDPNRYEGINTTYSQLNTYIPFYAGFVNKALVNEVTDKRSIIYEAYKLSVKRADYIDTIKYKDLLWWLINVIVPSAHLKSFRNHSNNVMYQVMKGCILYSRYIGRYRGHSENTIVKPLLVLCFAKDKYNSIGKAISEKKEPNPKDFVLIISNDINEVEHKSLYAQLRKHYIGPLKELGVDVLYTDDINKYCFQPLEFKKFSSFKKKQEYLASFNKRILTDEIKR